MCRERFTETWYENMQIYLYMIYSSNIMSFHGAKIKISICKGFILGLTKL